MSSEIKDGFLIKHAEIFKFRGIEESIVDDLSLINFFVGVNNSGKSTLLDAIYLGCKEPVAASLEQMLSDRVGRQVGASEIFFGYDKDSEAMMHLSFNTGHQYSLSISIAKEQINGEGIPVQIGQLAFHIDVGDDSRYISSYQQDGLSRVNHVPIDFVEEMKKYCDGARFFLSTVGKNELTGLLDNLLGKIKIRTKIEKELNEIMTDIYGEFQYEFIPRPERHGDKRIALKDGEYRIFSDFHGDGEQRALSILSTLKLSTDTAIFIEEIETFQHPRALRKLAKHLIELAKKNKVQLFITTHNYHDSLRFFYENAFDNPEERDKLFRCYVVSRDEGGVVNVKLENNVRLNVIQKLYKPE